MLFSQADLCHVTLTLMKHGEIFVQGSLGSSTNLHNFQVALSWPGLPGNRYFQFEGFFLNKIRVRFKNVWCKKCKFETFLC